MLRVSLFILVGISSYFQMLSGQVFVQSYARELDVSDIAEQLLNASVYRLDGELGTIRIEIELNDSNLNYMYRYQSAFFILQDSILLSEKKNQFALVDAPVQLEEHRRLFVRYSVLDDEDISLGEYLYEYKLKDNKREREKEKPPTPSRFSLHGTMKVRYTYNSANFENSAYPRHLFFYEVDPKISVLGIPLNANIRISPEEGSLSRKLSFARFSLDAVKYQEIRSRAGVEVKNREEQWVNNIEKKAKEKLQQEKQKLESQLDVVNRQIKDSADRFGQLDTFGNREWVDTSAYREYLKDSVSELENDKRKQIREGLDSLKLVKAQIESRIQKIDSTARTLRQSISDSLVHFRSLIKGPDKPVFRNARFRGYEIEGLSIGRFYPNLPKTIGSQSSVQGVDAGIKRDNWLHEFSIGKVSDLFSRTASIGLIRYSVSKTEERKYKIRFTSLYTGSYGKNAAFKLRNPVFGLEAQRELIKNGILNITGEGVVSRLVAFNNGLQAGSVESLASREQVLLMRQDFFPGYAGELGVNGEVAGFRYTLAYYRTSVNYTTALNPFILKQLSTISYGISKSILNNFLRLGFNGVHSKEGEVSELDQYKAEMRINPKRSPRLSLSAMTFDRKFAAGASQKLIMLRAQSDYSFQLFGNFNQVQTYFHWQRTNTNRTSLIQVCNWGITDLIRISERMNLNMSFNTTHSKNVIGSSTQNIVQNAGGVSLSYLISEAIQLGIPLKYLTTGRSSTLASGFFASFRFKGLSGGIRYDFNSLTTPTEMALYNRNINTIQTTLGYAF